MRQNRIAYTCVGDCFNRRLNAVVPLGLSAEELKKTIGREIKNKQNQRDPLASLTRRKKEKGGEPTGSSTGSMGLPRFS